MQQPFTLSWLPNLIFGLSVLSCPKGNKVDGEWCSRYHSPCQQIVVNQAFSLERAGRKELHKFVPEDHEGRRGRHAALLLVQRSCCIR
jgi:hypothetical protein